jgi:predicted nucleic acid-binding protein
VPAAERSFSDPPPDRLYLDTNIVIDYLISNRPFHARCVAFLDSIRRRGRTTIFLSSISWTEFVHVIRKDTFRSVLPDELQERLSVGRWQDSSIREQYIDFFLALFQRLIDHFDWAEVPVTSTVRARAVTLIKQFNLGTQDAIHVASAFETGVLDLASFDEGYRRVDGLVLWNDHIYATK